MNGITASERFSASLGSDVEAAFSVGGVALRSAAMD
jgi:hypothetical protein